MCAIASQQGRVAVVSAVALKPQRVKTTGKFKFLMNLIVMAIVTSLNQITKTAAEEIKICLSSLQTK